MGQVVFFDIEVDPGKQKILDIGAILTDGSYFHENNIQKFIAFANKTDYLCGHNIFSHDLKYIQKTVGNLKFGEDKSIDTLLFSPLLFPQRPYHNLVKDDKLNTEDRSNPLNDAIKSRTLFYEQVNAFSRLPHEFKSILFCLLHDKKEFKCFFSYIKFSTALNEEFDAKIRNYFNENICLNSDIKTLIENDPVALSYTLALINANDRYSITPPWVLKQFPQVERILFLLRNNPCIEGCIYCKKALDPTKALKRLFGFDSFRSYGGQPLQINAVNAAIKSKSILVVFPTGGGKSLTFQVPALMSGENAKALTVVISPLQSLMKDQVDNLEKKHGIVDAVTINGLLDPIDRGEAIERVESGQASLLYISPESLRSTTIERLLLKRKIARFVIDEAHCFSSWGQDFRVDYLYIGDFLKNLQEKKNLDLTIPVSCFTATAKQKVIEDIQKYFLNKLNLDLELIRTNSSRTNIKYEVFQKNDEEEKYTHLRSIIESRQCPTIVYVSRTVRAYKLAERLTQDGFSAKPYHGKMDKKEKSANQDEFMKGDVNIIVATSAFGMGVDKDNVGTVIHYDISDSLENYIQEAGRAGRNEQFTAECYVLFNQEDLDKHFILLNRTKITSKEINQVWRAIKDLTRTRLKASNSALEIARKAGWDDSINDIETRIKTAIAALEDAGYLKRGQNMPRVFANSILSKNAQEAIEKINLSDQFDEQQKPNAIRIIKRLFSSKSKRLSTEEQAESRIDYISDLLSMRKEEVIRIVELLREEKILDNTTDLTAFIQSNESSNRSLKITENYIKIEEFLLKNLHEEETAYNLKELNEKCIENGADECTVNKINNIINFWKVKNWVTTKNHEYSKHHVNVALALKKTDFNNKFYKRSDVCRIIIEYLYEKARTIKILEPGRDEVLIEFSVQELKDNVISRQGLFNYSVTIDDIEDSLFFLSRIEALKIEGGFLVVHNKLTIDRLQENSRKQYTESDYEKLATHYQHKVQQIHIVGEYAKKMIDNYSEALKFVDDYFNLNYTSFLNKYFPGSRQTEIRRKLTPEKFERLFGELSPAQLRIINDSDNKFIVVAAGPGSGKTRLLVHKLASLLLQEDVKHEQLLMLTFSRAAATDFKKKLLRLIGNAANFVEIKTFHSYCFDLLDKVGNLEQSDQIVQMAVEIIRSGKGDKRKITKVALVIDEAQDMNVHEFDLVKTLIEQNEDMKVILVGDDDQNIYAFRGSDSKYMQSFIEDFSAKKYELVDNYRSKSNIVDYSNQWIRSVSKRLKLTPGYAITREDGIIKVIRYVSPNLILPLVESILNTDLTGSTCILTKTNDEAVQLNGLLLQRGINSKLIQSNHGFPLNNLYELRFFTDLIYKSETPLIDSEIWKESISNLSDKFNRSSKLELALNIVSQFEQANPVKKYKSDWNAFLQESNIADFINIDNETVFVSTIHKSKGKEFNNVFMLLRNVIPNTDEEKRTLFVGMTRAKSNLAIHYNNDYFKHIKTDKQQNIINNTTYNSTDQVLLQLTHRDVRLGYFAFVPNRINNLHSGSELFWLDDGLSNIKGEKVLQFSNRFVETFNNWRAKGFNFAKANINFIVYWKHETKSEEVKIILPEIQLLK